ncbi:MAG: hypothetical protein IPK03_08955 [Bacteroidetes bacterium]|nr:hypothetical protein [Bacteroidota bacterium]
MIIEIDKVVSMTYELKIQNEQREWDLVDSSKEGHPLVFLYGHGNLSSVLSAMFRLESG